MKTLVLVSWAPNFFFIFPKPVYLVNFLSILGLGRPYFQKHFKTQKLWLWNNSHGFVLSTTLCILHRCHKILLFCVRDGQHSTSNKGIPYFIEICFSYPITLSDSERSSTWVAKVLKEQLLQQISLTDLILMLLLIYLEGVQNFIISHLLKQHMNAFRMSPMPTTFPTPGFWPDRSQLWCIGNPNSTP